MRSKNKAHELVAGTITSICERNLGLSQSRDLLDLNNPESMVHEECIIPISLVELTRARAAIDYKNWNHISRFNDFRATNINHFSGQNRRKVIILDEYIEDLALPSEFDWRYMFKRLIAKATLDTSAKVIFLPCKPDQKKKSLASLLSSEEITVIESPFNLIQLLKHADEVHTISSFSGFEAALLNKSVFTYGLPFYSGYGFTWDYICSLKQRVSIEQVFKAAYLASTSYRNPFNQNECELEDILEIVQANIPNNPKINITVKDNAKIPRHILRNFLKPHALISIGFHNKHFDTEWGYSGNSNCKTHIAEGPISTIQNKLRLKHLSLAIDTNGIYDDFRTASDLQNIINNHKFTQRELARAEQLITTIKKHSITKHNQQNIKQKIPKPPLNPFVIVLGHNSKYGTECHSSNGYSDSDSIRIAKERYPNHVIVFKPGAVKGEPIDKLAMVQCDIHMREDHYLNWLPHADAVITTASDSGFDALIRGVNVYCLGYPFYYGYGLTLSEINLIQRKRKVTITEFVAGTLICYPTYFNPKLKMMCRAEDTLDTIIQSRA